MKRQRTSKLITVPLMILAMIAVIFALKVTSSVLIPISCAVFLYLIFVPLASKLDDSSVPHIISTILVLLILIIFLLVMFFVLVSVFNSVAELAPDYYKKIIEFDKMLATTLHQKFDSDFFDGRTLSESININWTGIVSTIVTKASNMIISLSKSIGLIFVYLLFLMFERGTFVKKISIFYPDEQGRRITVLVKRIIVEIERYLVIKTVISLATGLCVGLLCFFVGYDLYFLSGLIAFVLNYIPSIGSIIATVIITILSFFQCFPNFVPPIIIFAGIIVIEMIIGNVIDPKVSGNRLNISPFMLLVSLAFWGYVWGVIGMLFSVPFLSILKIISSHVRQLKFVELVITNPKEIFKNQKEKRGGSINPALSEEENFIFGDEDKWSLPEEKEDEEE